MTREELLKDAKPILFNTDMVRAILDGRKTATRRVMKPQPLFYTGRKYIFADDVCPKKWEDCDNIIEAYRYQPGDILYVRERFCKGSIEYGEEPDGSAAPYVSQCVGDSDIIPYEYCIRENIGIEDVIWRPSIHMPKEAARIFLRVTDVRVERLKDITADGIRNEGLATAAVHVGDMEIALEEWKLLWNSTIKKSDISRYSWDVNPWVWVIEFERVMADE